MNDVFQEILNMSSLIIEIRGRLGDQVFYMRGGRICARRHVIPRNPRTIRQQVNRSRFTWAVRQWRLIDNAERGRWNDRAVKMNKSGYNLFIGEYLKAGIDLQSSIIQRKPFIRSTQARARIMRKAVARMKIGGDVTRKRYIWPTRNSHRPRAPDEAWISHAA